MITTKNYPEPPIDKKEILRYAGCKDMTDESLQFLLEECLKEVLPKLSYKVCYTELPLTFVEDGCDFGCMQIVSKDLKKNLKGCKTSVLFAATVGVEIDRLIAKYGHISPVKSVMLQAIGAERIESLCDTFCEDMKSKSIEDGWKLRPRFSPGYGDLPLEIQKDIFQVLNCSKNIGISLNDSLLMSPSKSVTAFVGIGTECMEATHSCLKCNKADCAYREELEKEEFR